MSIIKHRAWVTDIDEKEEILYAEMRMSGDDFTKYIVDLEFKELKKHVSESEFEELINMHGPMTHTSKVLPDLRNGRIFEIHEDDEDEEYSKVHLPECRPYTEEEIESSKKEAEELFKNIKWK